jgi:hypothetical protein
LRQECFGLAGKTTALDGGQTVKSAQVVQRVSVDHQEFGVMPGGNALNILLLAQIAGSD